MILRSIIEDVARYLSDYSYDEQYVHWSEDDLLSYAKLAVNIIGTLNKKAFTHTSVVDLREGSYQELPEDVAELVSIHGQVIDGVVQPPARMVDVKKFPALGRPICGNKKSQYKIDSIAYYEEDRRVFYVSPPVEKGQDAKVQVSYYKPPVVTSADEELTLDSDYVPALFELMLYYAWGIDIEDTASRERSQMHWNNAMTVMKLHVPYKTPIFNEAQ